MKKNKDKKNKENIIPDDGIPIHFADGTPVTWCMFCGSKIGQKSKENNRIINKMFYCDNCWKNYCDQCSSLEKNTLIQKCLRCESVLQEIKI